tara:strand:+ start:458 stop:688 length:231 start_codon:yes stop_codon:yes gene_type:complete
MKKSERDLIEILLKNVINMHEKLNIMIEFMGSELNEEKYVESFYKDEDKLVDIDKDTYETMCDLMGTGDIPFMGIA